MINKTYEDIIEKFSKLSLTNTLVNSKNYNGLFIKEENTNANGINNKKNKHNIIRKYIVKGVEITNKVDIIKESIKNKIPFHIKYGTYIFFNRQNYKKF